MKSKVLLAALSLPLVFTACSQDEWMEEAKQTNDINAKGYKVAFNVTKEFESENGAQTRADWDGSKITFEKGDKISVYWLGDPSDQTVAGIETTNTRAAAEYLYASARKRESMLGKFNSIFRTEGEGGVFTSEALVFEGGNVAVFPGDVAFVRENNVQIKIEGDQNSSTVDRVPYISNQLYIKDAGSYQTSQEPGYYGEGGLELDAPVKLAANVVDLTFNLTNIPQGYDFTVQQVELVTNEGSKAFSTLSNVTTFGETITVNEEQVNALPNYKGEVVYNRDGDKKATIIAQTWSKPVTTRSTLTTTALEGAKTATVKARFVVLPTDVTSISDAKILIKTNCGTITIDDTKTIVVNGQQTIWKPVKKGTTEYSVLDAIKSFVASNTASAASKFAGEKIGMKYNRSVDVDASTAELNNSEVYTDEDIKRYVNLYSAMGKTGTVNFVLSSRSSNNNVVFAGLSRETVNLINSKTTETNLVTLTAKSGKIGGVQIVGGGSVFTIKNLVKAVNDQSVNLVLSNEAWTMDDTFKLTTDANAASNPLTQIVNGGTLTIKGTLDEDGNNNVVAAKIQNKGTINLSGEKVLMNGDLTTVAGSVINIAAGQDLSFQADINTAKSLLGTINVNKGGFLTVADNVTVLNNGTINNWGTVAAEGEDGLTNAVVQLSDDEDDLSAGTINVMDDAAITYVQDNAAGIINLKNRDDEVRVESQNKGAIVYGYKYATDGATFKQYATDKFTLVVFGSDASTVTLHKSATDENGEITDGTVLPKNTSFKVTGTTKLISAGVTVKDLEVAVGANLQITTGNVLNVTNLTNNGTITIGGTINHNGEFDNYGRILSVGSGAIVDKRG